MPTCGHAKKNFLVTFTHSSLNLAIFKTVFIFFFPKYVTSKIMTALCISATVELLHFFEVLFHKQFTPELCQNIAATALPPCL